MDPSTAADLQRFVEAQKSVWQDVLLELRSGHKRTHWMWFIFPQIAGLGSSMTSRYFAIRDLDEARAYLAHPILGPRLRECTHLVNAVEGRAAVDIFGAPDDVKFRSSMTVFEAASASGGPFTAALDKYFRGGRDQRTLELIRTVDPP
jgi:uncharacterized protein (DUF1810 family)